MSRFFSDKYADLTPYTPGEQPRDRKYVKLNTNENPFPPTPNAELLASRAAQTLNLYPDPDSRELTDALARSLNVESNEIVLTNGSDDILNFAFMAFCDDQCPAVFANYTYGFYTVFAAVNHLPSRIIPLKSDFRLDIKDYFNAGGTIFIANPNAPTGLALSAEEIRSLLEANRDHVVVIDEAYVDFGAESCVPLIHEYDNLLVIRTFSKYGSLAGGRLGFGVGCPELIRDLNTLRYSTNPYNINRMTAAAGLGTLMDDDLVRERIRQIMDTRDKTYRRLLALGMQGNPSLSNFLFMRHPSISGQALYDGLRARGVLVRHFSQAGIEDYLRITIGTEEEMDILIQKLEEILKEAI